MHAKNLAKPEADTHPCPKSSSSALDTVSLLLYSGHDACHMISLHFDHTVFDCSARARGRAQLLSQRGKRHSIKWQALDESDAFTAAALGLQDDANHAIGGRYHLRIAGAVVDRLAAFGAHSPAVG